MKILKNGLKTQWKDIEYIATCHNCGCKFVYKNSDVEFDIHMSNIVKCPQCDNYVGVRFIEFLRKRYRGV